MFGKVCLQIHLLIYHCSINVGNDDEVVSTKAREALQTGKKHLRKVVNPTQCTQIHVCRYKTKFVTAGMYLGRLARCMNSI